MRNGKLSKVDMSALLRAWKVADRLSDYKDEHGEYDDVYTHANRVSDAISWLVRELEDVTNRG